MGWGKSLTHNLAKHRYTTGTNNRTTMHPVIDFCRASLTKKPTGEPPDTRAGVLVGAYKPLERLCVRLERDVRAKRGFHVATLQVAQSERKRLAPGPGEEELRAAYETTQVLSDLMGEDIRARRHFVAEVHRAKRPLAAAIHAGKLAARAEPQQDDLCCAREPRCPECGKARHRTPVSRLCPFYQWAKAFELVPVQTKYWPSVRARFIHADGKFKRPARMRWDGN